eukprot:m51a1_g13697 hypothetical protein (263) ;mRNA; f:34985-35960
MGQTTSRAALVLLTAAACASADFTVQTSPVANSDNVVDVSQGVAIVMTTIVGEVDPTQAQCYAWYSYARCLDDGTVVGGGDMQLAMGQIHVWGSDEAANRFGSQVPLVAGRVLQATVFCVAQGQNRWAPAGPINFRLPPSQQHPTGSAVIHHNLSTPVGDYNASAADGSFPVFISSQFFGGAAHLDGARCAVRYVYPTAFGTAWQMATELMLIPGQAGGPVDEWYGNVPLPPAAGGLLEATARCTYNGIEAWLGGNYRVRVL